MATLNASLRSIDQHLGFPQSRSRTVARRLQERNAIPLGAPGVAPELEPHHVVSLIVALAGYTVLHEAPDAVRTYRELTPAGAPIDALPASLQFSAGNFLDGLADEPENALKLKIEFVSSWPEIAIHSDGTVRRFVLPGFDPNHWQHSGHRRSTTINVAAFADVITELFGEQS